MSTNLRIPINASSCNNIHTSQCHQHHHHLAASAAARDGNNGTFLHCVQKKTPTHVFFYISVENVSIYTKFSEYVYEELSILRI